MRNFVRAGLLLALWACSGGDEKNAHSGVLGSWNAKWSTSPAAFPGVENVEFEMDGVVDFFSDSVAIAAFGYKGCIFSEDTLQHSLEWRISNDTLHLINKNDVYGMTYKILEMEEAKIELMLMDDIFLTLTK